MNDVSAVLIAALLGALAGLAGGGLAALASLRASQIAARAPLAGFLHELTERFVTAGVTSVVDKNEEARAVAGLELKWNQFLVHQRILCPSERIEELLSILRSELRRDDLEIIGRLHLSAQVIEKLSRIVGAHSSHLLRSSASRAEVSIISDWLRSEPSQVLSPNARSRLEKLV